MDDSFIESDSQSDSSSASYKTGYSKLRDLLSRAKLKLAEMPDSETVDKVSDEKSKSLDQVVEPPSSWRELPQSRDDITADIREDSHVSYDSDDPSAGTWESSDDESVADIPDIEDEEIFTTETQSPDIMTLDKNDTSTDAGSDLKSKLGDLLERVNSRMKMRSRVGHVDEPIDIRAELLSMAPTRKKVTFALPDDDPLSLASTEKSCESSEAYGDYSYSSADEFRFSDDEQGESDDRLKAKLKELNDKAGYRMRATTPTVLGSLVSRTQTPGPNKDIFDITKLEQDTGDKSDAMHSDSDDDSLGLTLGVFARPSPIGSPSPGKTSPPKMSTEAGDGDKPSPHVHRELVLDDSDKDDLELCFDSEEERDVPTRAMSRADELRLEMNTGRRSARPTTSDFFDDESDYDDDFRNNVSTSSDSELCMSRPKGDISANDISSSVGVNDEVNDNVNDGDKHKAVTKDTNQSCAALEMWHIEMQNRTSTYFDNLDSLRLREDHSNINPFTQKQNGGCVDGNGLRDQRSPELNLGLDQHGTKPSEIELLNLTTLSPDMPLETPRHVYKEENVPGKRANGRKSPGKKKKKKKKKAKKKAINPYLNMFPGNSYTLFDKPVLPPIHGQGGESWRSNSPSQTSARAAKEKRALNDDYKPSPTSKDHEHPGVCTTRQTKKLGDAQILEKAIAKINDCNKDLGQKFVPIETDVFDGPENPALKPLETRSLTVAKFRAQFNKNTTLLPDPDRAKEDNKIVKFMKQLKVKLVNPGYEVVDKAEKRRMKELAEYKEKLRAVQEETEKTLEEKLASEFKSEPLLPIGCKYVDAEFDEQYGYEVNDDDYRQNDAKLLKRQPGRIHIGNDFVKQENFSNSTFEHDVFYSDKQKEYLDHDVYKNEQNEVKGWEYDEGGKYGYNNKPEKYDTGNTYGSRNLHIEEQTLTVGSAKAVNAKDVSNKQGTIKIHSNVAMATRNNDKSETKKVRECIKQQLIAPAMSVHRDNTPKPRGGAMKAFVPFTEKRQDDESVRRHTVPKPPSGAMKAIRPFTDKRQDDESVRRPTVPKPPSGAMKAIRPFTDKRQYDESVRPNVPKPPGGAMKAIRPFTEKRQDEETAKNKQNQAASSVEQSVQADHARTSSRLQQASGLQREAVRPPQAPSTGKPSNSKMMRHRFQRLFNKMIQG